MSEGKEGQGFSPEHIENVPEIGKADFTAFRRKAEGSSVPMEVNGTINRAIKQSRMQREQEDNKKRGDEKYYVRRLRGLYDDSIGLLLYNPEKGYDNKEVARTALGLDYPSEAQARYAVDYTRAVGYAKTLNRRGTSIDQVEKSQGQDSSAFRSELDLLVREADRAEYAYGVLIKQEKKATGIGLINRIRHSDLTPEQIVETREDVENHFIQPQNPQN
jgi:hypothetical protein